jgi:dihydrolipoamide dehydrogenase
MKYDIVIVGGGPAGYVAAIRAGQLGSKTLLIEKQRVGGMCLNWGCIPTKALLESAKRLEDVRRATDFGISGIELTAIGFDWPKAATRAERVVRKLTKGVEFLLKKNGVEVESGEAVLLSATELSVNNRTLTADQILLATGTLPAFPEVEGLKPEDLFPFRDLLRQKSLPRRPVIFGDGPPAIEMVQFFSMIGAEPLLLSGSGRLIPQADPFVSKTVDELLRKSKVVHKPLKEVGWRFPEKTVVMADGEFAYDALINLTDRLPVLPAMMGFSLVHRNGFPVVDEHLQTSQPGIYAIGDVNGLSTFAHAASAQGLYVINHLAGVPGLYPPRAVPLNLYTWPEIAQVGPGEDQLSEKGIEYKVAEFPLSANGKSMAEGQPDGNLRILFEPKYGEILGVVIVAPHATDMIAEAVALMELEGTVADVARMVHAHPTVSEVMMEAAFVAVDAPVHR